MREIKGKKSKKRINAAIAMLLLAMTFCATAFAEEDPNDFLVDIGGGEMIDVEELAKKYNVDPYELKKAIEEGMNDEKFSPFSNLATLPPSTQEPEEQQPFHRIVQIPMGQKVRRLYQDATAYVADSSALNASGKIPAIGMCTIQANVASKEDDTAIEKIKLGTVLYMEESIDINGSPLSAFVVEGSGNASDHSKYGIDIYFGQNTESNVKFVTDYGVEKVNYYYYRYDF